MAGVLPAPINSTQRGASRSVAESRAPSRSSPLAAPRRGLTAGATGGTQRAATAWLARLRSHGSLAMGDGVAGRATVFAANRGMVTCHQLARRARRSDTCACNKGRYPRPTSKGVYAVEKDGGYAFVGALKADPTLVASHTSGGSQDGAERPEGRQVSLPCAALRCGWPILSSAGALRRVRRPGSIRTRITYESVVELVVEALAETS